MSDGRHLFTIRAGRITYLGRVEEEGRTAWKVRYENERPRRVIRMPDDMTIPASADPVAALTRWATAFIAHHAEIEEIRSTLAAARERQLDAARAALIAEGEPLAAVDPEPDDEPEPFDGDYCHADHFRQMLREQRSY